MTNTTKISCPKCGHEIDVNNIITHQLEEEYKKKLQGEFDKLDKQKQELEKLKFEQDKLIAEKVSNQLKSERTTIEKELKTKIQNEESERIKLIEGELKEKSEKVKELNRTKAEIEKIKREKMS